LNKSRFPRHCLEFRVYAAWLVCCCNRLKAELQTIRSRTKESKKPLGIGDADDSIGIMKTQPAANRTKAFTRTELFVVIGVLVVLVVAMLLPALSAAKQKHSRINCVNCLHQINLAFKTWEGDHSDTCPM